MSDPDPSEPRPSPGARRLRLVVEYDGTDFSGWQRQANGFTVQEAIERAAARIVGGPVSVVGAGRTDAGVHAMGQVAALTIDKPIKLRGIQRGLNTYLPREVSIVSVDEVPIDFDPRRDAERKLYRYRVWNSETRNAVEDRYAWHVRPALDTAAMQQAAALLVGRHDFAGFRAADCERQTTVRTMMRDDVARTGLAVTIEVEGEAFLKNMVRIISGTLVSVGRGRHSVADVAALLVHKDRTRGGETAPAKGLCLVRVDYALALPQRR